MKAAIYECSVSKDKDRMLDGRIRIEVPDRVTEDEAKRGSWAAKRRFKRRHDLHPCVKVDCLFLGFLTA